MSTMPYQVGTTYNDYIYIVNAANPNGVTGVGSTVSLSLVMGTTGNQAVTGLVVTEVDNVHNPGVYNVQGNATSSFISVSGVYLLKATWTGDTASPPQTFFDTLYVTPSGTMGGSVGFVTFTPIAGNGRIVTSGSTPLSGASVVVTTPAGVQYVSYSTNSSGLWGPIYFPTTMTGTWTVNVFLAGYQQITFTITTTSTTATGPGIDENMSVTTAGGTLTLATLMAYGRLQIHNNIGTTSDTQLKSAINDALARISKEYYWSWLKTDGSLILNGFQSTGTVQINSSDLVTVTLTGATWPSWAIDNRSKFMFNGKWYRVASQTNNTTMVLEDQYGESNLGPGLGYILFQDEYTLPSDCQKTGRWWPGYTWGEPPAMVSFETMREAQNVINTPQNYPRYAAIHAGRVVFWPYPQIQHDFRFMYNQQPAQLVNPTDVANWDPLHVELLYRAIDHELAIRYTAVKAGNVQETLATYMNALPKAINNDKESYYHDSIARAGRKPTIGDRTIPPS